MIKKEYTQVPKIYQIISCLDEGIVDIMAIKAYNKLQITAKMIEDPTKFSNFLTNYGYHCVLESNDYIKATPEQFLKGIDNSQQNYPDYPIKLIKTTMKILDNVDLNTSKLFGLIRMSNHGYIDCEVEIIVANKSEDIINHLLVIMKNDEQVKNVVQDTVNLYVENKIKDTQSDIFNKDEKKT